MSFYPISKIKFTKTRFFIIIYL